MPTYKVLLINVHNYETTVEASSYDEACDVAEDIDYEYLSTHGDEVEVDMNGFEVVEVEEE